MASDNKTVTWTVSRSSEFTDQLFVTLNDMRKQERLTDFTIRINDTRIPCHMVILAAACPYFTALFNSGMEEIHSEEVGLDILDEAIMKQIVDYMYTGEMVLQWNRIKDILQICDFLQLTGLKKECEKFVQKQLTAENCISWYTSADKLNLQETKIAARNMIINMFRKVHKSQEFKEFSVQELIDLIKSDEAEDLIPDRKLDAVIGWVMHDKKTRQHDFESIMEHIDLIRCSTSFLKHVFDTYESDLLTTVKLYKNFTKAALRNQVSKPLRDSDPSMAVICGDGKRDCWKLNESKKWTILTKIPNKISGTTFSICRTSNGFVIFGGGTDQCHLYDERTNEWSESMPLSSKLRSAGAACVHNKVFAVGGFDDRCDKLECLNLQNLKWKMLPKMLQKDNAPIVAASKNLVFAIFNTCPINKDYRPAGGVPFQCFDPSVDKWSFKASLPEVVTNTWKSSALVVDENLYAVGGDQHICLRYYVPSDTWTVCSNHISCSHTFGSAVLLGDKIYLTGGQNTVDEKETDVIDVFDLVTETWTVCEMKLPRKMKYHKAVCL